MAGLYTLPNYHVTFPCTEGVASVAYKYGTNHFVQPQYYVRITNKHVSRAPFPSLSRPLTILECNLARFFPAPSRSSSPVSAAHHIQIVDGPNTRRSTSLPSLSVALYVCTRRATHPFRGTTSRPTAH